MTRKTSVAGSFYPDTKDELYTYFEHFNKIHDDNLTLPTVKSRAVIVPHAGYVYSGFTANAAYRALQERGIKNFVVIGPSHRVGFNGVSLCNFDNYETPFGEISSADNLEKSIKNNFDIECLSQAHQEHSTEVQFPFIKHYLPDANIVELVYSNIDPKSISEIIDFVLEQDDCGVIISTDLSHFHDLKEANRLDNICVKAIDNLDTAQLDGCEACGMIGVEAMILSAKKLGLSSNILDYRTSADASNDTSRVVGYVSANFYDELN